MPPNGKTAKLTVDYARCLLLLTLLTDGRHKFVGDLVRMRSNPHPTPQEKFQIQEAEAELAEFDRLRKDVRAAAGRTKEG